MILLIQILYGTIILAMILASVFIVFHIIAYSFTVSSKITTLMIFVPITAIIILINITLFTLIQWDEIFSGFIL